MKNFFFKIIQIILELQHTANNSFNVQEGELGFVWKILNLESLKIILE